MPIKIVLPKNARLIERTTPSPKRKLPENPAECSDHPNFMSELRLVRAALYTIEINRRLVIVREIVKACDLAAFLSNDWVKWRAFCADRWWRGVPQPPTPDKKSEALRFVLRYVCGKDGVKQANFYLRAVAPLIEEGILIVDLPRVIVQRGGLRRLAAAHSNSKSKTSSLPADKDTGLLAVAKVVTSLAAYAPGGVDLATPVRRYSRSGTKTSEKVFSIGMEATLLPEVPSILSYPLGSRLMMEVTLDAVKAPLQITVHRVERLDKPSRR